MVIIQVDNLLVKNGTFSTSNPISDKICKILTGVQKYM